MWDGLIGPLERYDATRGTDLVETLTAFLESNGQWQATADRLHIHVNTLRQRLGRIEELTGRSLGSMDARVDLFLALRTRALRWNGGKVRARRGANEVVSTPHDLSWRRAI
jgi:DNA-binding PucR family transcriptional regulator